MDIKRDTWIIRPRAKTVREAGTATIEFVLVMPIVLFLVLVLVQTALLMGGQFYVHGAAFAATRSAIVQIPRDLSGFGEPANVIDLTAGSDKFDAIRLAAWLTVMPVSGRDDTSEIGTDAYVDALREHFEQLGQTVPRWVDTLIAECLGYAAQFTEVELMTVNDDGEYDTILFEFYEFGPKDVIAVRITHKFNLSVPYVRAIFADDYHETKYGNSAYTEVVSTYILNLEGINPALPPEPALPRK